MKICVIIPVHNESKEIGRLVQRVKNKGFDVLVIDDGSTDFSGRIAKEQGAMVLTHDIKKGKGQSLRDGFEYVKEKPYTGVITMDGDGQHAVEDLDRFIARATQVPQSVIVGSRMDNAKGMPAIRFLTNKFMSSLISSLCHQHVPDTQCGFRYLGSEVLKHLQLNCNDFEIESEVLMKASRNHFKIYSVPIQTIYRDEKSKINPLKDTFRFFNYIIKELFFSARSS